jgi:hypothetical protein
MTRICGDEFLGGARYHNPRVQPQIRWLVFSLLSSTALLSPQPIARGLEPGAAIPKLSLPDQTGRVRTFEDIRGPKGALIVFYRSADW